MDAKLQEILDNQRVILEKLSFLEQHLVNQSKKIKKQSNKQKCKKLEKGIDPDNILA